LSFFCCSLTFAIDFAEGAMYAGQHVFAQPMDHLPWHVFRRCVARQAAHEHAASLFPIGLVLPLA
jgi:hypothetical protein